MSKKSTIKLAFTKAKGYKIKIKYCAKRQYRASGSNTAARQNTAQRANTEPQAQILAHRAQYCAKGANTSTMIVPSANTVNYSDALEICGYQLLLCKIFEAAGGFAYPRISNKETLTIRREGKEWLKKVRKAIDDLFTSPILPQKDGSGISLSDIPALLGAYDFFYRICHGAPCFDYLRKIRLMAANRYAKGDKSISQTQVALMLRTEANRDARSMEQRYLEFSGSVMESWIEDLEKYGRLRHMPLCEAYDILKFLLSENLLAFLRSDSSKLRWIRAYTLSEEEIEALDIKALIAYIGFEQAAESLTGRPVDEQSARHKYRFSELSTRPDLHPFYKESILIDLAS